MPRLEVVRKRSTSLSMREVSRLHSPSWGCHLSVLWEKKATKKANSPELFSTNKAFIMVLVPDAIQLFYCGGETSILYLEAKLPSLVITPSLVLPRSGPHGSCKQLRLVFRLAQL